MAEASLGRPGRHAASHKTGPQRHMPAVPGCRHSPVDTVPHQSPQRPQQSPQGSVALLFLSLSHLRLLPFQTQFAGAPVPLPEAAEYCLFIDNRLKSSRQGQGGRREGAGSRGCLLRGCPQPAGSTAAAPWAQLSPSEEPVPPDSLLRRDQGPPGSRG